MLEMPGPALALALLAGAALGGLFYGGLWWTVRNGVASRSPLWFLVSFPLRMLTVLAGFYAVSHGHPGPLIACLLGFTAARLLITRRVRSIASGNADAPQPR